MKLTIEQALQRGIAAHKEGKLQDAERLYRAILQSQPNHPDANHNLGVLAVSVNKADAALQLFKTALEANPKIEQFWLSYIGALIKVHQFENARHVLKRAKQRGLGGERLVSLEAQLASKNRNHNTTTVSPPQELLSSLLGHYQNVRFKDAEKLALSITNEFPKHQFAWKVLGVVLGERSRIPEALAATQRAIELSPKDAESHSNLGIYLWKLGRLGEAEESYKKAIALKPDSAVAYRYLGLTLKELGRLDEAEANYNRSIELKPDFAEAYNNLGNTLKELGRYDDAESSYNRAITLKPGFAEAQNNLGITFSELGKFDEAEASFRRAIALKPDYTKARSNLLFLNASMNFDANCYHKEAQGFVDIVSSRISAPYKNWLCSKNSKILRVGFVSGDFKDHPVGYFLEGLLVELRSYDIELYAYPTDNPAGKSSERLKTLFESWNSLSGKSDRDAAQTIYRDRIDILVDLAGHTAGNRLAVFSWKPAPIQITWLGYFASTGLPEIDYILGDPFVTPQSENHHFTEAIWQLPNSYLCFTPPDRNLAISSLPALKNEFFTFGCFNNLSRMTDEVVSVRAKILHAVPNSKLFLKDKRLGNQSGRARVLSQFASFGISEHRLILEGKSSREKYLACYHRVDIALAPFPYGGGTTSVEGLWMGVPVITKKGDYFLSHLGESIAHNSDLANWIARDNGDYIAKALEFSSDLSALELLRQGLRKNLLKTPLFDMPKFANNFETALWKIRDSIDY